MEHRYLAPSINFVPENIKDLISDSAAMGSTVCVRCGTLLYPIHIVMSAKMYYASYAHLVQRILMKEFIFTAAMQAFKTILMIYEN